MDNLIGEKMKRLRTSRNLTQQEVAEMLGVSKQHISRWEAGIRGISGPQLIEYAKAMQVTLDYFTDKTPERTMFELMAQLESVFEDAGIPEDDKDKAYQDIIGIYLNAKKKASTQKKAAAEDSNTLLDLKEE